MWAPSARGPRPRGVLTTSCTLPPAISSTASPRPPPRPPWPPPWPPARPRPPERRRCPRWRRARSPGRRSWRAASSPAALSRSARERKTVPSDGQPVAGGDLALGEGQPEGGVDPHDLAGRAHLGPEQGVHAGEPVEREHRLLHRHVAGHRAGRAGPPRRAAPPGWRPPSPGPPPWPPARRWPWPRRARCGWPGGWPRARSTCPSFTANCTLTGPPPRGPRRWPGCGARARPPPPADRVWGGRAQAESPECTPGLLHVLHDPADHHLAGGVAHGVHVDLDGVLQEPVDEHRALGGDRRPRGPASRRPRPWPPPPPARRSSS